MATKKTNASTTKKATKVTSARVVRERAAVARQRARGAAKDRNQVLLAADFFSGVGQ